MKQLLPCYLASASPRRREILTLLGIDFTAEVSDADEHLAVNDPTELVQALADRKATAVRKNHADEDCFIIGSDTIVVLNGKVLGKPADKEEAAEMLRGLSGNVNTVYTGVCIQYRRCGQWYTVCFADSADVQFADLSESEIEWYINSENLLDKAGAYAIQGVGGRFIESIHGDFYTIMGLPMQKLYKKLVETGLLFV